MKHLNIHSYCVANSGKQPMPASWLAVESFSIIRGTENSADLGCSRVFE